MADIKDLKEQVDRIIKPFNPNEGVDPQATNVCRLPQIDDVYDIASYAEQFTAAAKAFGGMESLFKAFPSGGSTVNIPPSVNTFSKITYMPNQQTQNIGVIQWPGLPPEVLEKLAREHSGMQLIISTRVDDVLRYAELSTQPWKPGWEITTRDPQEVPDAKTRREIREAEKFIQNSGYGEIFDDPIERDAVLRDDFTRFLAKLVRNTLTFDGISIFTDRDKKGLVTSYCLMPAQNIRLLSRPPAGSPTMINHQKEFDFTGKGPRDNTFQDHDYQFNPDDFAVAVDESGTIVQKYSRSQLVWYCRNSRVDASIAGYGLSEAEQGLEFVTGFTNAVKFNSSIFDRNSVPKGLLLVKGEFAQRQLDALGRIWDNLQRGPSTEWTLPAMQVSEKGAIELVNLEPLRKESAYYAHLVNLFIGCLCVLYRFPPHRFGFKISGTERDPRPDVPRSVTEEVDTGLPILLSHIENIINSYLLDRWPHLKFVFHGKSPKEDAREYEYRKNAMTWGEQRAVIGMVPLADLVESDAAKEMAEILSLTPVDPSLTGVWQSIITTRAKIGGSLLADGESQDGEKKTRNRLKETPGAKFNSKKDPGESLKHGAMGGVRRNSRAEKKKDIKGPTNLYTDPLNTRNQKVNQIT